ncbi:hypothetical protein HHI36_016510 [Cryptolaemus montrouzieri]|uniref:Uncharacterized protein n=1 Tax=Cryptolaemus montrouzieri TaxID=559131 RepID=A0ABD2NJX5_9CUCU
MCEFVQEPRRVSDGSRKRYAHLQSDARICSSYRKEASSLDEADDCMQANSSNQKDDFHMSEGKDSLHSRNSPEREVRSQKEIDLEELLNELKGKFINSNKSDHMRVRILTIAPSS